MKKTIIVNVPMTATVHKTNYNSKDSMLQCSAREVFYPVSAFLESTLKPDDEVKCILLLKESVYSRHEENAKVLEEEFNAINEGIGAQISYEQIISPFAEDAKTHEKLMYQIVKSMEQNSHVILDMTFGPKDLPIVEFSALNFAERFCGCSIDYLISGQHPQQVQSDNTHDRRSPDSIHNKRSLRQYPPKSSGSRQTKPLSHLRLALASLRSIRRVFFMKTLLRDLRNPASKARISGWLLKPDLTSGLPASRRKISVGVVCGCVQGVLSVAACRGCCLWLRR